MDKDNIKNILRHKGAINEFEAPKLNIGEDSETQKFANDEESEKATPAEYERLKGLLDNDKINHAGVIKQLWGTKDATKRSLFRRKLNQLKNDGGGTQYFSKEEVSKIFSILMNFANEISSSIKPSKQTYKGDK